MSNSTNPHREKALSHVVTGLIAKRKELAGIVQDLEKRSKTAALELAHVEAALRVFKPDIDMARFNPRPVRPRHAAFKGETSSAVLHAIREAGTPLGTNELTDLVMKAPVSTYRVTPTNSHGAKIIAASITALSSVSC